MQLSAAIIAGGHSRRMGSDKALLPHPTHGTLVQRQLELIQSVGPTELLVSCRPEQILPLPADVRRIHDPGTQGPLAGLAALLEAAHGDHLLVIGVDLGQLTPGFLQCLVSAVPTASAAGMVPRTSRGLEPLAAIYPLRLAAAARSRLDAGMDLSLQGFVFDAMTKGALSTLDVLPRDESLLANWNTPEDLPPSPNAVKATPRSGR